MHRINCLRHRRVSPSVLLRNPPPSSDGSLLSFVAKRFHPSFTWISSQRDFIHLGGFRPLPIPHSTLKSRHCVSAFLFIVYYRYFSASSSIYLASSRSVIRWLYFAIYFLRASLFISFGLPPRRFSALSEKIF